MKILNKLYSIIYDTKSIQTNFNDDEIGIGGESENVIPNTENTTKEE